jgi:hypothetical protein
LSRRVRMPTADDLFRPTVVPDVDETGDASAEQEAQHEIQPKPAPEKRRKPTPAQSGPRTTSGRVKHDEKMTVYVTADELLDLEHARLSLRRSGLAVDRGRLVREAVAIVLADLEANGDDSAIVRRLLKT